MADILWWLQVVGGFFSVLLMAGGIVAAVYSTFREAPGFIRRLTGVGTIEHKVDQLLRDQHTSQQLQRQQAEAFNELKETVCEEHDIPPEERPEGMDEQAIRQDLLGEDYTDFRRGSEGD